MLEILSDLVVLLEPVLDNAFNKAVTLFSKICLNILKVRIYPFHVRYKLLLCLYHLFRDDLPLILPYEVGVYSVFKDKHLGFVGFQVHSIIKTFDALLHGIDSLDEASDVHAERFEHWKKDGFDLINVVDI